MAQLDAASAAIEMQVRVEAVSLCLFAAALLLFFAYNVCCFVAAAAFIYLFVLFVLFVSPPFFDLYSISTCC